jgi:hypothetical protein
VQTQARSTGETPWLDVLRRATDGDCGAVGDVRRVVYGFLHRYRAYDVAGEWEDIWQDVACVLFDRVRASRIRGHYAFVNYTGKVTFYTLLTTRRALRKHAHAEFNEFTVVQ